MTRDAELPQTARSLPIALLRAREGVMRPIREMLLETGITEQQWRILRLLKENGPMSVHRLANNACILLPSITRIATNLRNKGLITQEPDTRDRRRQVIEITEAGLEIIEQNSGQATEIAARFQDVLGQKDYQKLLELLERLAPGPRD